MSLRALFLGFTLTASIAFGGSATADTGGDEGASDSVCHFTDSQTNDTDYFTHFYDFGKNLLGYKSDVDVDLYIKCWSGNPNWRKLYLTKYRKAIMTASEVTGVPFSILACLFFRESEFNQNAKSPAKPPAVGIAQFTPDTWKTVLSYLNGNARVYIKNFSANLRKNAKEHGDPLDKDRDHISPLGIVVRKIEDVLSKTGKNEFISDPNQLVLLKSLLFEYRDLADPESGEVADQYQGLIDIAQDKAEIRKMYDAYVAKLGQPPKTMDRTDPEAAIILGACNLKVLVFGGLFAKDHRWRDDTQDRWVIAAGAYNSGVGHSKCNTEMTADECIDATKVTETKNHMISIKRCAEQGDKTPMTGVHETGCYP